VRPSRLAVAESARRGRVDSAIKFLDREVRRNRPGRAVVEVAPAQQGEVLADFEGVAHAEA
jgi:hypothetical protein